MEEELDDPLESVDEKQVPAGPNPKSIKAIRDLYGVLKKDSRINEQPIVLIHLGSGVRHIETWEREWIRPRISNSAINHVIVFPQLRELSLTGSQFTDAGLANLFRLKQLEYLHLDLTTIGDVGLQHLRHLKKLREVSALGKLITDKGGWDLRESLPDVQVHNY